MNNRQHRSNTRNEVDELNREIARQMESLKYLEKYSSRVETVTSSNELNNLKNTSKVLQVKPSSRGHKKFTVSELYVASNNAPNKKYSHIQQNRSNKQNIMKNQSTTSQNKTYQKQLYNNKNTVKTRSSLKTQSNQDQQTKNHQKSIPYYNPNHYVSQHIVSDNLFGDYQLSDSESDDKLFPEDSLNFQLKQDIPKETTMSFNNKHINGLTPKKQFIEMLQSANRKSQFKRKITQKMGNEYSFKPTILDKSKQIADRLEPSYTRLTSQVKNKYKQNTYKQPPSSNKTYSKQRLNNLSRPRVITADLVQEQQHQQCTFKPVLSKKSLNQFNNCNYDVITRNQIWSKQRQDKIQKLKKSQEHIKNQRFKNQCSAVKIKSIYKPEREVNLSQFGKQGMLAYFQRLQSASNIKKRQKDAQTKFSGKNWNGNVTKPQQFKLSSNSPIQSSYRSRSKNTTTTHSTSQNPVERQYQKAIKQLHDKIQKLHL